MAKAATGSFDAVVRTTASKAAVEGVALQMGELSELLGYSLKRAQLKVF